MSVIDQVIAPDFVNHTAPPGVPPTREGGRQLMALFRAAFPDGHMTIEDMLAEGDKVVTRKTFHGTHQGEFMGIPPTGRQVAIQVIDIVRVVEGQVVEHWNAVDNLGLLQQLGVIPAPSLPPSASIKARRPNPTLAHAAPVAACGAACP